MPVYIDKSIKNREKIYEIEVSWVLLFLGNKIILMNSTVLVTVKTETHNSRAIQVNVLNDVPRLNPLLKNI
jgi:hypothetical protein